MAEQDQKTTAPRSNQQYVREDKGKTTAAFDNASRDYKPPERTAAGSGQVQQTGNRQNYTRKDRWGREVNKQEYDKAYQKEVSTAADRNKKLEQASIKEAAKLDKTKQNQLKSGKGKDKDGRER